MQDSTCKPSVLATHAGADEADENIGVLPAPTAEGAVEPVHLFKVRTPECHVAAAGPAPAPRTQFAHCAEPQFQQRREAVELAPRTRHQPTPNPPQFGLNSLMKNAVGQIRRQQNARAGDEPARLGKATVCRHEVLPRNAVAVEKEDICAGAGPNTAITDVGQSKAA